MSLSGNLGFVPIDEVLRLLTRAHQQGSVDVTGNGVRGRVFIGESGIDLATTFADDELHHHLVNSRYADERSLERITSGETTLAAVAESNTALIDLLRELTVESIFQMASRGVDFAVRERETTPYASPKSFDLEALLRDAEERRKEWAKVTSVIPDLNGTLSFRRDLGDRDEVTVKVDDWKVLSEIGTGSSVHRIAEHLGTTEFWTARVAARLVNNDLVVVGDSNDEDGNEDEAERYEGAGIEYEPATEAPSVDAYAAYEAEKAAVETEQLEEGVFAPSDTGDEVEVDADESWWQEPRDEIAGSSDVSDSRTPEVVSEGLSEMPSVGEEDLVDSDVDVEEDTEAFLEKVFSKLDTPDSSDSEDPEARDEGHGLLRRRRMGMLRDFSSDS